MTLIPNWREAWKFMSVQLAAILALLSFAYDYLPAVQQYLPEGWVKWMALAIIVVRIVKQYNVAGADVDAALRLGSGEPSVACTGSKGGPDADPA
jgi:hypothetical protein